MLSTSRYVRRTSRLLSATCRRRVSAVRERPINLAVAIEKKVGVRRSAFCRPGEWTRVSKKRRRSAGINQTAAKKDCSVARQEMNYLVGDSCRIVRARLEYRSILIARKVVTRAVRHASQKHDPSLFRGLLRVCRVRSRARELVDREAARGQIRVDVVLGTELPQRCCRPRWNRRQVHGRSMPLCRPLCLLNQHTNETHFEID